MIRIAFSYADAPGLAHTNLVYADVVAVPRKSETVRILGIARSVIGVDHVGGDTALIGIHKMTIVVSLGEPLS